MRNENMSGQETAESAAVTTEGAATGGAPRRRVGRALKWILAVFVIALLAIAGFRIVSDRLAPQETVEEPPINVRVTNAAAMDINSDLILTGRLEAA